VNSFQAKNFNASGSMLATITPSAFPFGFDSKGRSSCSDGFLAQPITGSLITNWSSRVVFPKRNTIGHNVDQLI
jgi:hypothetical protein